MELGVGVGRGYEAADRKPIPAPAGAIALDAAYSPITRVSYNVEMSRLGKITDYEKLVVEVWTNGAVSPDDALTRSATYLREHFTRSGRDP
jgi:DNA-directed RNA polymerase subunit alpha